MAYTRGYPQRAQGVMNTLFEAGKDGTIKTVTSVTDPKVAAEKRTDIEATLGVMAQMGYAEVSGTGETLAFRILPDGLALYQSVKGA